MKNLITFLSLAFSLNIFAAATTPMTAVESTSHIIDSYTKSKKIDASFLTNITKIDVLKTPTGIQTIAYAPSATAGQLNTITTNFDTKGKVASVAQKFTTANPQPIFINADAATLIDLGSEAVVDHLNENSDLPTVDNTAVSVSLTAGANSVLMSVQLSSGKIYKIKMDQNGNVLSQGF